MAIFHLTHKFLKRSRGASSISKAAYNAGQKLENNEGSSEYSDYTRKGGVLYDEITLPAGNPSWANERGELWRRLEAREDRSTRRADAILAHNIDIALPHELTLEQNIFLARDYVREQFTRKGYAVDWAIHSPDPRGDSRNIHLHILVPLRRTASNGESFGIKDRYTKQQLSKKVSGLRSSWATLANRHLKRYGHEATIDERSLKAQGSQRKPTKHRGIRPKSTRYQLDNLRAKQPPLPIAPIIKTTKQTHADGSIIIQRLIKHTVLTKIQTANQSHIIAPILNAKPKGWPPAAVAAWEAWGSENPVRFFTVWPELTPEGFVAATGPSP